MRIILAGLSLGVVVFVIGISRYIGLEKVLVLTSKELEIHNRQVNMSSHQKLLLFCYMKGGSTYFSSFFKHHPDVMFWYEPFAPFYHDVYGSREWIFPQDIFWSNANGTGVKARIIPDWEIQKRAMYNHNLLNFKINSLPVDTLVHQGLNMSNMDDVYRCISPARKPSFRKICSSKYPCNRRFDKLNMECMTKLEKAKTNVFFNTTSESDTHQKVFDEYVKCREGFYQERVKPCEHILSNKYSNAKLIAYKEIRIKMSEVKQFLETDPDMRVVYLVRDPRSIVASRFKTHNVYDESKKNPVLEAKFLCLKMMDDFENFTRLKSGIYSNSLKFLRYEDLIYNPREKIGDVYSFVETPIHPKLEMHFKTSQRDPETQINKWKKTFPLKKRKQMTKVCYDVLKILNYPTSE